MDESLKTEIIESIKEDFPDLSEERITNLLEIILLEIESYNSCKNDVSWEKLKSVISEVLYQIIKNESEKKYLQLDEAIRRLVMRQQRMLLVSYF